MSRVIQFIKEVNNRFRDNGLTPIVRSVLVVFAIGHLAIGIAAAGWPHLYSSGAYEWVADLVPIRAWGVLFLSSAALSGFAAWKNNSHVARVSILLYVFIQCMFAGSIFKLTLEGSVGAFAGTFQWLLGPVIAVILISNPIAHPIFKKGDE